ncbi:MAG TPA: aldo/keto reductase [Lachnospiraceae bacterium]|nr:aldo/keto reductase [Lachnospiraceae bacterium]
MKYENLEDIKTPVSRIVFGTALPAMIKGENVNDLLDSIYAEGITTFDTAENYGLSEISLGTWMKARKNRDKIVIISKGCHPYGRDRVTPEDLKQDIEQSFERLHTDYIDIYMLHRDDLKVDVGPIVEILNEYKKAGKIGRFGGSNWTVERMEQANEYAYKHGLVPFTVSEPNFGLCDQIGDPWGGGSGCVTISGPAHQEDRDWYAKNDIPVFAYSSLGRGMFSGRVKSNDIEGAKSILDPNAVKGYCYPENFERLARVEKLAASKNRTVPQIALAWVLNQDFDVFPLVSVPKAEWMASNLEALDISLSKEEVEWLDLRRDNL